MRFWMCSEEEDGVRLALGSDCEPRAIEWLWKHWLPARAVSILAGAPGTGKTSLALALASIVSRGAAWPDGHACGEPGNVVIWSGEDDISSTLVPRLVAMAADMSRIHFVTAIQDQGRLRQFDPALDMRQLMLKIAEIGGANLVIVDPLISVVMGDSNKAGDVRRDLADLVVLANSGSAVLGITHFSKGSRGANPLDRVLGSQAFAALARVVLVTAKRAGHEERVVLRAKSNIGPDGDGHVYRVEQCSVADGIETSRICWGDALEGDVDFLMREIEQDDSTLSRLDEAKIFLKKLFENRESMAARDVYEHAQAAGHATSTINRAKADLNIKVEKQGNGGWLWRLNERPKKGS